MTKQDEQVFKKIIIEALGSDEGRQIVRESTLDALRSSQGQGAIVDAMRSEGGQGAVVDALNSIDGQSAIKRGSLSALKSEEGQNILLDHFVDTFHEIADETFETMTKDIKEIKENVAILSKSAVKREEFSEAMRKRLLRTT